MTEVKHVEPSMVGRCSHCGKATLREDLDTHRGLCMDCFDEALIDEFGREGFGLLMNYALKVRGLREWPKVRLDLTQEELEEMADADR